MRQVLKTYRKQDTQTQKERKRERDVEAFISCSFDVDVRVVNDLLPPKTTLLPLLLLL